MGGSHVSAGRVDLAKRRLDAPGIARYALDAEGSRDELLDVIRNAALAAARPGIARWGVAVPGPFDYERGVAKIRGVWKLEALFDVDLRSELAGALNLAAPDRIRFLNDAHAFLLGEWWAGGARGHARAMGVTLGTGLGSAFLVEGAPMVSGPGLPPEGRLDLVPFRGRPVEDVISTRGILAAYGGPGRDVAEIARRAHEGDGKARATFREFGAALGEFIQPWLIAFRPSCLLFGGSIARAWDLFAADFQRTCPAAGDVRRCGPADRLDDAALLGAAFHATREPGSV